MKKPKPGVDCFDPEEITATYAHEIVMASWLYYHAREDGLESPLTDAEYDQRVQYVVANWASAPIAFRARITRLELSGSGVSLKTTSFERRQAREWAKERHK